MTDGRKKNGGPRPNSGRKSKADENDLQALLRKCWPKKQRAEMLVKWAERAARGDLEAGKLLMAYGYGKPVDRKELSSGDGLKVLVEYVSRPEDDND